MLAFVQNHRRAPRIPLRLPIEVSCRGEAWPAETEDIGPGGCLVLSPRPLARGAMLWLTVRNEERGDALRVRGAVAWAHGSRYGVAYAPARAGDPSDPASWFERRLRSWPRMAASLGRVPAQLPSDALLYALPVPRRILDLTDDEVALARKLENGVTVEAILARSGLPEDRAARAMLALFEKNVVTLSMGQASDPWRWRAALGDSGRSAAPPPPRPANADAAPAAKPSPPRVPRVPPAGPPAAPPLAEARRAEPCPAPVALPSPASHPASAAVPPPSTSPTAGALRASAAWKSLEHHVADPTLLRGVSPTRRCHEAQAHLDEARAAAGAGRIDQAVALLRRALVLAPRDPEISHLLGELAFKDRQPRAAPQLQTLR